MKLYYVCTQSSVEWKNKNSTVAMPRERNQTNERNSQGRLVVVVVVVVLVLLVPVPVLGSVVGCDGRKEFCQVVVTRTNTRFFS